MHTNRLRSQISSQTTCGKQEPGTVDIVKYLLCHICMCVIAHLMGTLPPWVTGQTYVNQTLQANVDFNWGGEEEWVGHFM